MEPEVRRLIAHQFKMGNINDGDMVYIKLASDGTNLTKKEVATVTTITISNEERALAVGTVSIVMAPESYEV